MFAARKSFVSSVRRLLTAAVACSAWAVAGAEPAAARQCDPFPSDPYVGTVSHDQVVDYVRRSYGGDWSRYIKRHATRIRAMNARYHTGGTLAVDRDGTRVTLSGQELAQHISRARNRLGVLRCLSRDASATVTASAEQLNSFATAASGPQVAVIPKNGPTAPPAPDAIRRTRLQLANASGSRPLDLAVEAACRGQEITFKVANIGAAFPGPAALTVYRIDLTRQSMKSRRMRLESRQSATFNVKTAASASATYGLSVDPSWYARPLTIDATVNCG